MNYNETTLDKSSGSDASSDSHDSSDTDEYQEHNSFHEGQEPVVDYPIVPFNNRVAFGFVNSVGSDERDNPIERADVDYYNEYVFETVENEEYFEKVDFTAYELRLKIMECLLLKAKLKTMSTQYGRDHFMDIYRTRRMTLKTLQNLSISQTLFQTFSRVKKCAKEDVHVLTKSTEDLFALAKVLGYTNLFRAFELSLPKNYKPASNKIDYMSCGYRKIQKNRVEMVFCLVYSKF